PSCDNAQRLGLNRTTGRGTARGAASRWALPLVLLATVYPSPSSRAGSIASARPATCIVLKIVETWLRTVLGLSTSFWAIAALVYPCAGPRLAFLTLGCAPRCWQARPQGLNRPILLPSFSVNHRPPSGPVVRLSGPLLLMGSGNSVMAPCGVIRPRALRPYS